MDTSKSMAAFGPKQDLKEWTFELRALGPDDVEMKLAYCGICHSDIHSVRGEWGDQSWPIVPGHELVGYVTKIGSNVKQFQIGQRIGVGPQAISCLKCESCTAKRENYCYGPFLGTYGSKLEDGYVTKGGYAHFHRAHSRFVVPIPDALPSAAAAPLLCAGATTYTPLKYVGAGPGKKIGVIGIGGLGHVGVKIAAAMGAHVVAISSSESKREEAKRLGATEFINHSKEEEMKAHEKSFDMILNTVSAPVDLKSIIGLIKPHGNLTNVGMPEEEMRLPASCMGRHVYFTGTSIGSPSEMTEMLEFCAKHDITADIELFSLENVNEAFQKVLENSIRYRAVLAIDEDLDRKHRGAQ